jgi:hypothetical protein
MIGKAEKDLFINLLKKYLVSALEKLPALWEKLVNIIIIKYIQVLK